MSVAEDDRPTIGGPMKQRTLHFVIVLFLLTAVALAQDVASFEKRITVKKLPNGLTVIVCERPEAPVFSFFTMVDAGSAQDPMGANRTRAHVRAHGLQGHRQDRHYQLRRRKACARKGRSRLRRLHGRARQDRRSRRSQAEATRNSAGKTRSKTPTNTSSATNLARSSNRMAAKT